MITYNGEIYNYRELRRSAWPIDGDFGPNPTPNASSPVMKSTAREFLSHLRGMFAFAMWDERKQRLIAARDRFGIKPFYYALRWRRSLLSPRK